MKRRMACAIAIAAGSGLGLNSTPVLAAPSPLLSITNLQLSLSPDSVMNEDGNLVITVGYQGGSLLSVALYLDGRMVHSNHLVATDEQGKIRFELDPSLLSAGRHSVTIKAMDIQGNEATAHTTINYHEAGPASMIFPGANSTVQGVVPIEIQVDPALRDPYVSFFIDNKFEFLTNRPPYTLNWNSERVENGPHLIEIEVLDSQTQILIKRFRTQILVANQRGFTNRETITPDLRTHTPPSPVHAVIGSIGELSSPSASASAPEMQSPAAEILPILTGSPRLSSAGVRAFASPDHVLPAVHFQRAIAFRPGAIGMFAAPHDLIRFSRAGLTPHTALAALAAPRRMGNFAALPPLAAVQSPVRTTAGTTLPNLAGAGATTHKMRTFQVAFDNSVLAFDVPPRIQEGIPLAPFRQIFEHTGGVIKWFNQSKTVRAINSSREIEIHIGDRDATVNNETIKMQATPYIDHGRTIVPLSFVRDALNVIVHFDPKTGRLMIQSKH